MKILFSSHAFYPNVGGIETVSLLLAKEFAQAGHLVKVITQTPATESEANFSFKVFRSPSAVDLLRLTCWADVVFHNNISLKTAWPLLLVRRPWVVAHHGFISCSGGLQGFKGRLKHWVLYRASGIAISEAIAKDFKTPCTIIPNPYDDRSFRLTPNIPRNRNLIFVGRLIPSKGVDMLICALARLKGHQLSLDLTIVGGGPDEARLRRLSRYLEVDRQIDFVGVKQGMKLSNILNSHKIMVVPSIAPEPFGVVALEGIACGCAVVGSQGGGLKDAIGPCGFTFPNGDLEALVGCLEKLLTHHDLFEAFRNNAPLHLARYRPKGVAQAYLKVIEDASHCQGS